MNKNDFFILGYISKTVGIKGEVIFTLDVDEPKKYQKLESVFVEINNSLVPFFLKSSQVRNNTIIAAIDGIDNPQKASELIGSTLYLPLSFLPPLKGNKFYFHEVPGYSVIDKNHGAIGIVESILDFPQQAILQIKNKEIEILVPVKDDFILNVDRTNKTILIQAPEGLIDLYLSEKNHSEEEE